MNSENQDTDDDDIILQEEDLPRNSDPAPDLGGDFPSLDDDTDADTDTDAGKDGEGDGDVIVVDDDPDEPSDDDLKDIKDDRIRNRIMRERRLREKDVKQARVQAQAEIEAAKADAAEARKRERAAIARQVEYGLENAADKEKQLRAARISASEQGDHEEVDKIDADLRELKVLETQLRDRKAQFGDAPVDKADQRKDPDQETKASQKPAPRPPSDVARKWVQENSWFDPNGSDLASVQAIRIGQKLALEEGLTSDDPQFFDKISRQLVRDHPDLEIKNPDGKRYRLGKRERGRVSTPMNTGGRGGEARGRGDSAEKIDEDDLKVYRSLGLDTSDPNVRKRLLRERKITRRS